MLFAAAGAGLRDIRLQVLRDRRRTSDADIADPLRYTRDARRSPDGDDGTVEAAGECLGAGAATQERPVSGSLGLLAKARGDRERLVAALYAEARYDGVVDITIDGRAARRLPPDAEFAGRGPIPVTITIDRARSSRSATVTLEGDAAGLTPAEFGLVPGGDAGSDAILKAEAEIVRRAEGGGPAAGRRHRPRRRRRPRHRRRST